MKALIADDDVFVRKCLAQMIPWGDLDFSQVLEAENGSVALKIALEEKPDLIISDVKMPILDGLALAERLKESMVDICLIILSEYSDFAFVQKALKVGVQDYILKPITRESLKELREKISLAMEELEKKRYYTSLKANYAGIQKLVHDMLESGDVRSSQEAFEFMATHQISKENLKPFGMMYLSELFAQALAITLRKAEMESMRSEALTAYAQIKKVSNVLLFVCEQCERCVAFCARRAPQTVNYVTQIALYIEKNYADPNLSVATISDWLHLSPVYTGALYKQHQGKSIIASIHEVRLRHAKELLRNSAINVANVSKRVGYMTPDYFSRLFSAAVGISPSQYRSMMILEREKDTR